jgi:hypothetical protein
LTPAESPDDDLVTIWPPLPAGPHASPVAQQS